MDIIGPLGPTSKNRNRFILVIEDYFTKWPEAYAIPTQEARVVAQKLVDEWVSRFGVMQRLHSHQGRNFESNIEIVGILGIKKARTTSYHPQSDGMVVRFNRTLLDMLAKVGNDHQDDWDRWIPQVMLAYRSTTHMSTGISPHYMNHDVRPGSQNAC